MRCCSCRGNGPADAQNQVASLKVALQPLQLAVLVVAHLAGNLIDLGKNLAEHADLGLLEERLRHLPVLDGLLVQAELDVAPQPARLSSARSATGRTFWAG